jgi:hypothetical protein
MHEGIQKANRTVGLYVLRLLLSLLQVPPDVLSVIPHQEDGILLFRRFNHPFPRKS